MSILHRLIVAAGLGLLTCIAHSGCATAPDDFTYDDDPPILTPEQASPGKNPPAQPVPRIPHPSGNDNLEPPLPPDDIDEEQPLDLYYVQVISPPPSPSRPRSLPSSLFHHPSVPSRWIT